MRKPTKKAIALLVKEFTKDGKVMCSGVSTYTGSAPLWGQLVLAGFVKEMPYSIGHPFNYWLTDQGRKILEEPFA